MGTTPKTSRENPGWKLEAETIATIKQAREVMNLTGCHEVIEAWAATWQKWKVGGPDMLSACAIASVAAVGGMDPGWNKEPKIIPTVGPVDHVAVTEEKAARVETPYQAERRERLEKVRAALEAGEALGLVVDPLAAAAAVAGGKVDPVVLPFGVEVNGEAHRVIEFKGRRVLVKLVDGSPNIMLKNLTPQETVIYWNQRTNS